MLQVVVSVLVVSPMAVSAFLTNVADSRHLLSAYTQILPLALFGGRRFLSFAWFRETGLQLIISNSTFPYLFGVTTYCCWDARHIGHPPYVEESRKDSQTAWTLLHSVVGIWPKEISHLHSNIKGGRADSLLLHPVFFFPAGDEGWGEMHARKLSSSSTLLPKKPLMRDWNPSLYFLEHLESQRVIDSLRSSFTWLRKEGYITVPTQSTSLPQANLFLILFKSPPRLQVLKWWFLHQLLPCLLLLWIWGQAEKMEGCWGTGHKWVLSEMTGKVPVL